MDLDHARDYIRDNHHAVMATTRADGRPQMSPVACGVDADGMVVVARAGDRLKTKNLVRDPNVSLCVFPDGFYGEWVQVDGVATVVPLPDALDGLVDYYRQVAGEHPDWDDYRNAMVREHRVLVRIALGAPDPPSRADPPSCHGRSATTRRAARYELVIDGAIVGVADYRDPRRRARLSPHRGRPGAARARPGRRARPRRSSTAYELVVGRSSRRAGSWPSSSSTTPSTRTSSRSERPANLAGQVPRAAHGSAFSPSSDRRRV